MHLNIYIAVVLVSSHYCYYDWCLVDSGCTYYCVSNYCNTWKLVTVFIQGLTWERTYSSYGNISHISHYMLHLAIDVLTTVITMNSVTPDSEGTDHSTGTIAHSSSHSQTCMSGRGTSLTIEHCVHPRIWFVSIKCYTCTYTGLYYCAFIASCYFS